jgi:hypothetical protein
MKTSTPEGLPPEFTLAQLRWLLNVSSSRVQQLEQAGVVVRTRTGHYRGDAVRNYVQWLRKVGDGPRSWQDVRTQIGRERLAILRLERGQLEGDLLEKNRVRALGVEIMTNTKSRLLTVPNSVAPRLVEIHRAQEAEQIVRDGIVTALEEIARLGEVAEKAGRRKRNGSASQGDVGGP